MRSVAFLGAGFILILIQGELYHVLGLVEHWLRWLSPSALHGATPSLLLPLVVFLGVHESSMLRGALLSFVLGYLVGLHAAAPLGLFSFIFVSIWWLSRLVGVRLTTQRVWSQMALAFAFAIVESAMVLTMLAVFGQDAHRPLEVASVTLPHAISTALFAPFGFALARRLQRGAVRPKRLEQTA